MNIYDGLSYKAAVRAKLAEKKRLLGNRFTFERLAERIGIQKSYLSRVMRSDGPDLSADQLYQVAVELGFTSAERSFLLLLLEHDRCGVAERRRELAQQIAATRAQQTRSETHLSVPAVAYEAQLADYFVAPELILVHMFLCVERFRADVRLIGTALRLSGEQLAAALTKLERYGCIKLVGGRYQLERSRMHLPVESPFYPSYRALQRLKALERCQQLPPERAYNFSVTFSADEATRQRIKTAFLTFLAEVEQLAKAATDAEVYQLNFDLFDWSLAT